MSRQDPKSCRFARWSHGQALWLTTLLTVVVARSDAAVLDAWVQRYGGQFNRGNPEALAVDRDGNVLVTGSAYIFTNGIPSLGYYTAKYAGTDGVLLWERRFNGPLPDRHDMAAALGIDSAGNAVVTGTACNTNGGSDFYTVKYAGTNGALLWEQRYSGLGISDNGAWALAIDSNDDVIVTGRSFGGSNTVKYAAADGVLLWEQRFNGQVPAGLIGRVQSIAVDRGGNVAIASYYNSDIYTARFSGQNGRLLWEKHYNGPANLTDFAQAVAIDPAGDVVVTGYSGIPGDGDGDFYTAKYAAEDGDLIWERRHPNGRVNALAVDGAGNVVVTGSSTTGYCTVKYAGADGTIVWEKYYTGPVKGLHYPVAVAVEPGGNVLVTGYSSSQGFYDNLDFLTLKYAADGAVIWEKRYNGPFGGHDIPVNARSIALGRNGMVFVTGTSAMDIYGSQGFATVAYREVLNPVSIKIVTEGIRLRFTGIPGTTYSVERASSPSGSWTVIESRVMPAGGLTEFVDTHSPSGNVYYRTSAR